MCSYNELNGVPACYSPFLRDVLRGNFAYALVATAPLMSNGGKYRLCVVEVGFHYAVPA